MQWLALYFAIVIALAAAILIISYFIGPRHAEPATDAPYEGGILSQGSARLRFSARFYMIAVFFVIFDLEAVFLFAWSVAARELGWSGYWEMLIFIVVLAIALAYLWRVRALEWSEHAHLP